MYSGAYRPRHPPTGSEKLTCLAMSFVLSRDKHFISPHTACRCPFAPGNLQPSSASDARCAAVVAQEPELNVGGGGEIGDHFVAAFAPASAAAASARSSGVNTKK